MLNVKAIAALERFLLTKPIGNDIPLTVGETVKAKVVDVLASGSLLLKIKDGYINVRANVNINFEKNQELLLKVLPPKDGKVQLEIVSVDGKTVNSQTLDIKPNFINDTINKDLTNLKAFIENSSDLKKVEILNENVIKNSLENSGIFFERKLYKFFNLMNDLEEKIKHDFNEDKLISKLKEINLENFKEKIKELKEQVKRNDEIIKKLDELENTINSIKDDLKFKVEDQKVIDSIKNLQLNAILNDTFYGVFGFKIPGMKVGDFEVKKVKLEDGEAFYFRGSVDFEDGKVNFLVARFKEGFFISIKADNEELREKMKEMKGELYKSLNQQNIKVVSLDVY